MDVVTIIYIVSSLLVVILIGWVILLKLKIRNTIDEYESEMIRKGFKNGGRHVRK